MAIDATTARLDEPHAILRAAQATRTFAPIVSPDGA
jgi:hypothetical protein